MNSPIAWAGGKARLSSKILPHIPAHVCWVEPFAGGLGMFFNKPRSKYEVVNDMHRDLINLFRVAKFHPDALMEEMALVLYSREEFEHLKRSELASKTDVQRAAWFFHSLDQSFGAKGLSAGFGYARKKSPASRANYLKRVKTLYARLDQVTVECLDYADCLKRYDAPGTFFFIDPPYIGGSVKQYDAWKLSDLESLRENLSALAGQWLLTMSAGKEVERIFAGFKMIAVSRQNIIDNRKGSGKKYQELLIMPESQVGGFFV